MRWLMNGKSNGGRSTLRRALLASGPTNGPDKPRMSGMSVGVSDVRGYPDHDYSHRSINVSICTFFNLDRCYFGPFISGENYDGDGGCVKYTDKWAERLGGEGEAPEQVRQTCLVYEGGSLYQTDAPLALRQGLIASNLCMIPFSGEISGRSLSRQGWEASMVRSGLLVGTGRDITGIGTRSIMAADTYVNTETARVEITGTTWNRWTPTTIPSHILGEYSFCFVFLFSLTTVFGMWEFSHVRLQLAATTSDFMLIYGTRYDLAVKHSPDLVNIPLRRPNQGPGKAKPAPEEEDVGGLGGGMDDL